MQGENKVLSKVGKGGACRPVPRQDGICIGIATTGERKHRALRSGAGSGAARGETGGAEAFIGNSRVVASRAQGQVSLEQWRPPRRDGCVSEVSWHCTAPNCTERFQRVVNGSRGRKEYS